MLNRFYIKGSSVLKNEKLLNKHPVLNSLKNAYSRNSRKKDSSRGFKKPDKTVTDKKVDKSSDKNPEVDMKVFYFRPDLLIGGGLVLYGVTKLFSLKSRLSTAPVLSYEQFEEEYLLHGEVRLINLLSDLSKYVTGCTAEAILYYDDNRAFQRIGIKTQENIHLRISKVESDLHIGFREAVRYTSTTPELSLILGASLLFFKFRHKITPGKKPGIGKSNEEFNIEKILRKQNISENPVKQPGAEKGPNLKKVVSETKKQQDPVDIFSMILNKEFSETSHKTNITFKDVAGLHSAKIEVKEFLDYLNYPSKFIRLGARLPKGAMLLGPPGCGKTLLVKALANESNVPFYYKAGSDFIDKYGGMAAKRIRSLFQLARNNAPAIIFIDEIDAIGKKRAANNDGMRDGDQTLNQLLVEMDGMNSINGVVVFAATNRVDILDQALTRPGRFDRHIYIDLPVLEERKEIFTLFLSKFDKLEMPVAELKDKLALLTPGMSGADISNLCNEGAITAAKFGYKKITEECFDIALERVIAGAAKKTNVLNKEERKLVAYHESGHVIVGWFLKYTSPILKVTIVPRTNAMLGFVQTSPIERYWKNTDILYDEITELLGGRAAENVVFNQQTSGARNDLKKVKDICFSMVRRWGMSDKIGHLSFSVSQEEESYGILPYSKSTQALIEAESNRIIATAYKRAESIIREHMDKLELVAEELLKKEVLNYNDIKLLIGPQPNRG